MRVGLTDPAIHRRVSTGRWRRVFPGVYLIAPLSLSWEHVVTAACLAGGDGAVASHRAAARLWNLGTFEHARPEVSFRRGRARTLQGVLVHRPNRLDRSDRTVRLGIPVTTPSRTLIDLAGVVSVETVEEALDEALRRGLTSPGHLQQRLDDLVRKGRKGVRDVQRLLEARAPGDPVTESRFETLLLRLIMRGGLPEPVRQYVIHGDGRPLGRVDFAYPEVKLAVEADGFSYHSGRARFERDRARRNALTAVGWRVINVTWHQLRDEPDAIVALIAGFLAGHRPGR